MVLELKRRAVQLLALSLMMAAAVGFALQAPAPAYATSGDPAIVAGAESVLKDTANTADAQKVWYAGQSWWVLSYQDEGNKYLTGDNPSDMTLFATGIMPLPENGDNVYFGTHTVFSIGDSYFDTNPESVYYGQSVLRRYVDGLFDDSSYGLFSEKEQKPVVSRMLEAQAYSANRPYTNGIAGDSVQAYLWPLSMAEADTDANEGAIAPEIVYLPGTETDSNYWLRSPGRTIELSKTNYTVATIEHDEMNDNEPPGYTNAVRPAFYLTPDAILFTSAAQGGKASEELAEIGTNTTSEWKLTLKDDDTIRGLDGHKDFEIDADGVVYSPSTGDVTVPYSGATTGDGEYISALIKDADGNITHYGAIQPASEAAGEVTVNIGDGLAEGSTLYIFNEQCNGDQKTDYASALQAVPGFVTVSVIVGNEDAASELYALLSDKLPEGAVLDVAESGDPIYISFREDSEVITDDVIGLLEDILDGDMDEYYGTDYNPHLVGFKEAYESEDDLKADVQEHAGPITDGLEFYVQWWRLVEAADVTVTSKPVCGLTVTGTNSETQDPKPSGTVEGEGIDTGSAEYFWWTVAAAKPGEGTFFEGTAEYGTDFYVFASMSAQYGYYFDMAKTACSVNGSKADDSWSTGPMIMIAGTIPVVHDWGPWEVTKEPTVDSEGVETRVCKGDPSHTETRAIPALDPAKAPGVLIAKMVSKGQTSLAITWSKVQGADGYDVYFAICNHGGKEAKYKKIKTVKAGASLKVVKKGLKKGTAYKAYVKAFVKEDGKKRYIKKSPVIHAYSSGGTKAYTNAKSVKVKKASVTLAVGKTAKVKASVVKLKKGKKLMPATHEPKLRYLSSNKSVATVSSTGKITAKGKGTCKVYAIAHDGASKAVKVTVK